jgi:hypothetical protein
MIDGKRVVAWTPFGREETASILHKYLKRDHERGIVDEWWLCLNTDPDQVSDLRFGYKLARENDFVKAKDRPTGLPRLTPKQRNTGYFCRYMTDPDTVYVRLDDDIIYVHDDAIEALVRHKLETPQATCSFPIMWNNSIISWFLQNSGVIPAPGTLGGHWEGADQNYVWPKVGGPYCMDATGWADGGFAVQIHRLLLAHIKAGTVDQLFLYQDFPLQLGMQFSVSTFAALGSMYAGLEEPGVLVPYEEESWHTIHRPQATGVPNMIVGNALVSHYTFFPQRGIVTGTDVLAQYRELADKL